MEIFVAVVRQESFTAAARALKISNSHVSKQIERLEEHLGVRLRRDNPEEEVLVRVDGRLSDDQAQEAPSEDSTDPVELNINTADSSIDWVGAKVTGDHTGGFNDWSGKAALQNGELQSISFEVDTRSIFSDNDRLTGHLKSDDFFDVENHPEARFVSTRIVAHEGDDATHHVTGTFTIRGVTKSVTFPASITVEENAFRASTEFTIDRFDFGIEYAGMPDDLIRKEVLLKIDLVSP